MPSPSQSQNATGAGATKKKRAGRIVRKDRAAAEIVPGETPAAPPAAAAHAGSDCFDPGRTSETLGLWWENKKEGGYYMQAPDGRWLELNLGNVRQALMAAGVSPVRPKDGLLSDLDRVLCHTRSWRALELSLPGLAGYFQGCYDFGSQRVLVRSSPTIIKPEPVRGGWPTWNAFLTSKLGEEQKWRLLAWVKFGYEALVSGSRDRGQICIFIGRQGIAKSRIQHFLLTPVFGGRRADPGAWLYGIDRFCDELARAEHLLMEDPPAIARMEVQAHLRERLKALAANDSFRVAAKFASAENLDPWWRVSLSVNDTPEHLRLLPALTPDLADKVLLFKVSDAPLPMPTITPTQRRAFRERLAEELPALLYELTIDDALERTRPHMFGGRFGLLHYADPELAARLREDEPEMHLWELIQHILSPGEEWTGSALDLENRLQSPNSPVEESAKRFFRKMGAAKLLGRLASEMPETVSRDRSGEKRWWIIKRPAAE